MPTPLQQPIEKQAPLSGQYTEQRWGAASRAQALSKKSILRRTAQIGGSTLLSRFLGIIREVLMVRFLGAGPLSDAFLTAYKIPNSLRKFFAEGALSAALVPTFVHLVRHERTQEINRLMSAIFLLFEGILLVLCAVIMWHASAVASIVAPGFSAEQAARTADLLRIVMPFIFFISSSAVLAGALQSVGHFFVPAFSPVLLNIVFVAALGVCLYVQLPITALCYSILLGGALQLALHIATYFKYHFSFAAIDAQAWRNTSKVVAKFLPCLLSMSVVEINLFVDSMFVSYMPAGSTSLLFYANRFMGIPLGVFGVAFSTILLPHLSRVVSFAPKRLGFYLYESAKLIFWVMIPVALMMGMFADKIFSTIFDAKKFTAAQVGQAQYILIAFLLGLFSCAFNKILLNAFYALRSAFMPAVVSVVVTVANVAMNVVFMKYFKTAGLALATSLAMIIQTAASAWLLYHFFGIRMYGKRFMAFAVRYILQLAVVIGGLYVVYTACASCIMWAIPQWSHLLLETILFWAWVGPLCGLAGLVLFYSKNWCGLSLYFLD